MPVPAALDALGVYWKRDPDFVPVKDKTTVRLNVALDVGVVDLLSTGPLFYFTRAVFCVVFSFYLSLLLLLLVFFFSFILFPSFFFFFFRFFSYFFYLFPLSFFFPLLFFLL